jgi:hypothetical protein
MSSMKALQIDLLESMKASIDRFMDGAAFMPAYSVIIKELRNYFTFDEIFDCMDIIEGYLNELEGAINND